MTAQAQIEQPVRDSRAAILRSVGAEDGIAAKADAILLALREAGLTESDPRLQQTQACLSALGQDGSSNEKTLTAAIGSGEGTLVNRALSGQLAIPDFAAFQDHVSEMFAQCRSENGGHVATYIPQLARVSPDKFALGACTVDGQRFSLGDDDDRFCVQSTCKPINYAIARDLLGRGEVHKHVGREPSGKTFNELTLNTKGLPHNPMINAGAIMCASMIKPKTSLADRFDYVMDVWSELAGGSRPGFDNTVFLSEKATADRNFALAYFMRENGAFPEDTNLHETLDFYFQCCSITVNVQEMSLVAATLANGGICPITNRTVFTAAAVKDCLSLMYSCGMYDFSGEYAFTMGIPAKSGVSGALMLVVPGVCGFALWSPPLDACGNSVRGVEFSRRLVEKFSFHSYAGMVDDKRLIDPTVSETIRGADETSHLCGAAAKGDMSELRRLIAGGADVSRQDYDGRSPLHLAASEGQLGTARILIAAGAALEPRDRWGNTPLDDAKREKRTALVELLTGALKQRPQGIETGKPKRLAKAAT